MPSVGPWTNIGAKMPNGDSPFIKVPASQWLAENRSAFVIADLFPVSPGHALVVPRRVIGTWKLIQN